MPTHESETLLERYTREAEVDKALLHRTLPKMLPQPASGEGDCVQWYTSDQMRAYGEACAKAERERLARLRWTAGFDGT